jgi:hypothetical protein
MKTKLTVLQRCIICIMSIGVRPLVVIRHLVVKLNWPTTVNGKIEKSKNILTKTTGNPNLPSPYPTNVCSLTQLGNDIAAVDTAQNNVNARVVGAVQDRNAKHRTVKLDLESIMFMVQIKANANPANAIAMILTTGFDYKVVNIKQKQQLGVRRTDVSGAYILLADGGGQHEWQLSPDKVNITNLPATSAAHALVTGLTLFKTYYQRNRKVGKKGVVNDWSAWYEFTVK